MMTMNKNLESKIILELCKYFSCSDCNDLQYPTCILWDTPECEAAKLIKRLDPLFESKDASVKLCCGKPVKRYVSNIANYKCEECGAIYRL